MRKIFLSLLAVITSSIAFSQSNVAYIYSTEILNKHPEYIEAKKQVDIYAENAKKEVEAELEKVKSLFNLYEKTSSSMQSSERKELQDMIISMEKEANIDQEEYFGNKGKIYQKQKELMVPVENKVIAAVNAVATKKGYDIVFDLSIVKNTIFQSPKVNITSFVMTELGIKTAN